MTTQAATRPPSAAPTKRATAMAPEERRAAIVEAVRPLLVEHGEAITTKQIATAAGIAEGTIFRVFADKDELLDAVLGATVDQAPLEAALRAIDRNQSFEDQLLEATVLLQKRVVDVWTLLSHLSPKRHEQVRGPMTDSPELAELFAAHPSRICTEPATAARYLRALTMSLTHPLIAAEAASAADIVDLVLHGIGRTQSREETA
ncbi:MAG: helix-turn-helix domain-containing protein [Actinomycetota bacterium]